MNLLQKLTLANPGKSCDQKYLKKNYRYILVTAAEAAPLIKIVVVQAYELDMQT